MKHHIFAAEIPKKLFRDLGDITENDKKGDSKQEIMFGRAAKIPIGHTPDGLVEMDFAGAGDFATFLSIRGIFSRFSVIVFMVAEKKEEQTSDMVRGSVISNGSALFGGPEIMETCEDSRFIGGFSGFFRRAQYNSENGDSGTPPKFRGKGT